MADTFEQAALAYFKEKIPRGYLQRIDGVECFSPLSKFWFWRWRLNRLVKRGLLIKKPVASIWASCNGMPAYGIKSNDNNEKGSD